MMFLMCLITGSLISISASSWMGMWMGLEINLISFMPLLSTSKNLMNNESTLKYFITQAIASTIMLFAFIYMSSLNSMINNFNMMMIFNSAILMKMGAAPFHFWFPEIMEGLYWNNCLILLTWQKLAPMILIMYNKMMMFFSMIIIISMIISGIMGMNQTNIRKILAYSSINHIGWMIGSMMFSNNIWLIYFLTYFIISLNIILIMKMFNIFNLKQLFIKINNNMIMKMFFIMNFLSLGGLPPFLGFMPKWLTIQMLLENKFIMVTLIMVIMTLMTLYFYMQITFSTLMINMNENNYLLNTKFKNFYMTYLNTMIMMSLIFITFIFNLS
nr:NADH dehydrogenase subunit 2 [Hydraena nigrita]